MSPYSCATLLLLLFASVQNACIARPRPLGATQEIVHDELSSEKSNLTNNKKEMSFSDEQDAARVQTTSSGIRKASKKDGNNLRSMVEVREGARSLRRVTTEDLSMKRSKHQAKIGSGGAEITYQVPQRTRGDRKPGFNLDYSPPKVHPPHHN